MMAVVQKRNLDELRGSLVEWLSKKLPNARRLEISRLDVPAGSGFSNETFLFEASWTNATVQTRRLVARTQVSGPGLFPTYDVMRQASVMETLARHSGVPVPTILWKEHNPSALGTPFFVMERLDGRIPPDNPPYTAEGWVFDLDPAQRETLYNNGLRVLAGIHALECDRLDLSFLERPRRGRNALDREISCLDRYYTFAAAGRKYPIVESAFEWIRDNRPSNDEPVVLNWGDPRIGNIIFGDDLSVMAVLDWELSSFASPEQDLGHWLFQDRKFSAGLGLPSLEGFPTREVAIARYEAYSGREVRNVKFYETLEALRSSMFHVRQAAMMIEANMLPPESEMAQDNAASRILADLIGLPDGSVRGS
jgi:aminoglycoside phosphotransferase (APT) family kinase protein